MARECVEGFLGDEMRDLDVDRPVFGVWDGCKGNNNAISVVICDGMGIIWSFS